MFSLTDKIKLTDNIPLLPQPGSIHSQMGRADQPRQGRHIYSPRALGTVTPHKSASPGRANESSFNTGNE